MRPKRKRKYTFKRERCSPSSENNFTCYKSKSLYKLKANWNKTFPKKKIKAKTKKAIWKQLKKNMNTVCSKESCWLKQNFIKNKLNNDLINDTFAPSAPSTWKKNKREWLNNLDITNVMKQYESKYKDFRFIGPTPIDYDYRKSDNTCILQDLCKFDLSSEIKRKIKRIGIIFNLDPHYKGGSHWVAYYLDIPNRLAIYWDSTAEDIPRQILKFHKKIVNQGKELNMTIKLLKNKIEHQKKDTECGIYCIYFLEKMLEMKYPILFTKRISDDEVYKYRYKYFNVE